ncbi:histidinol-phosphate transaminase [Sporosarcina sp. BI001-red]|uniref:histidinol-phosphate transaminase n=1 Tax=Sporosarcina sp. BI001-red TaxID=2282866 RepID=UPI000E242DF9|nr:histidinol-phosphate transaminase [Sporosarcina sp. BI001-red]REB06462.1 histidinol-phosphate transaminase [Sporosarcina sp. BI001-red]
MNELWSDMVQRTEPYTPGEQANGEDWIKLNTNENPYPPSPRVFKALQQALTSDLRKYPESDPEKLRYALAELHQVSADQVFIGNGSDEVLAFSFMAFFTPGKPIVFPAITYSFYPTYAALFNIAYDPIPLQEDFTLNEKAFYKSEGGVIFPNPNAPTGIVLPLETVERIVSENEGRIVIVDEAYIDFGGKTAIPLITRFDNLLVTRTMSKSRSLAGLRIGYAIGSTTAIEALNRIKNSFNSYTIDQLALTAGVAAVKDTKYFNTIVDAIIQTREQSKKVFESVGFTVLPSAANFLFVHHPEIPAKQLHKSLKDKQILVRHFSKPETEEWLRITIGSDDEMEQFFQQLFDVVNAWTDKSSVY